MVATPPTLEELLEKTVELVTRAESDTGMPKRMKAEAKRLDQKLTNYHYLVEVRRQELAQMARLFLKKWHDRKPPDEP